MNQHGARTTAFTRESISLRAIMPIGFLVLTCCMAQVEAGTRQQPEEAGKSAAVKGVAGQQEQSQQAGNIQPRTSADINKETIAPGLSDAVQEGRLLLAGKPSESKAKQSKDKGKLPAKRLDASAEEEEEDEEEDEEAEEETTTGKGSPKGGVGMGSRGKSIQADFDNTVRATLKEIVVRGAVLSVVVSLSFEGGGKDKRGKDIQESQWLSTSLDSAHTHLLHYETGTTYSIKKFDGFYSGRLHVGQEEKTLRATFEAPPKSVKTVGITIAGVGTFDDVRLGSSGAMDRTVKGEGGSGKGSDTSKTKDADEEDVEDEEEGSKGLTGKKGAKKRAK